MVPAHISLRGSDCLGSQPQPRNTPNPGRPSEGVFSPRHRKFASPRTRTRAAGLPPVPAGQLVVGTLGSTFILCLYFSVLVSSIVCKYIHQSHCIFEFASKYERAKIILFCCNLSVMQEKSLSSWNSIHHPLFSGSSLNVWCRTLVSGLCSC